MGEFKRGKNRYQARCQGKKVKKKFSRVALGFMNQNAAAVFGCIAVAIVTIVSTTSASAQRSATIDLGGDSSVSKSIILPVDKAAIVQLPRAAVDVLVSQPSVVDAVVRSPQRVYLLGLQVGQANAFFFDKSGNQILNLEIRVERDVDALTELLARLMPNSRITAEAVNDHIILRGSVKSSVEAANASDIAGRFVGSPENVISLVSVRQREQVMLRVRVVEMQRSIVKQLGFDVNGIAALSNAAINAAASTTTAGAVASGATLEFLQDIGSNGSNIGATFQALERIGVLKTLAEPTLTAVSGESANFLAGGEFPIPVAQIDNVVTLEFKQFGIGLGFTPLVLDKGNINLKVSTEVSEITTEDNFALSGSSVTIPGSPPPPDDIRLTDTDGDGIEDTVINLTSIAAGEVPGAGLLGAPAPRPQGTAPTVSTSTGLNIPAFTVRRAKTTVELPSGGSLVMAGLLQENMRETVTGIPALKDVPLLGQLFRSRDYQNSETELVIIATPFIVKPTDANALTDPSKGFVSTTDAEAILLGKMTSTYGLAGQGVEEKALEGPIGFILD
ncbi:MAG: type II and III secretion system protein family protein [Pseudomonadota bacterium]